GGNGSLRSSQASTASLTPDLLSTVVVERMHHAGARHRGVRRTGVLHRELEAVLLEELVEHLAAEGADGVDLVRARILLEQDGGERLRGGAGHHPCARGRVVLAVLGAAMDHRGMAVPGALLGAKADEADVAGGVGELVGADRGVGDYRTPRTDAAVPL